MAISTYCCHTLPPPASSVPSRISRSTELACPPRNRSSRNRVLLGLMCATIIASESLAICDESRALTGDMGTLGQRWSDRTSCQPWRMNSLESIVPENLPRPSARRRWESTVFPGDAPIVKAAARSPATSCFTL